MESVGKLGLVMGPMFSGKTTELMRRFRREKIAKRKAVIISPSADTRYDKTALSVCSHDGARESADLSTSKLDKEALEKIPSDVQFIALDEAHLFEEDPDLVAVVKSWLQKGINVCAVVLSGDFKREPFAIAGRLVAIADSIVLLSAICSKCGAEAHFTTKTAGDPLTRKEVGGEDMYAPVCGACVE